MDPGSGGFRFEPNHGAFAKGVREAPVRPRKNSVIKTHSTGISSSVLQRETGAIEVFQATASLGQPLGKCQHKGDYLYICKVSCNV